MVAANIRYAKPTTFVVWTCFASIVEALFVGPTSQRWKESIISSILLAPSVPPFLELRIVTMNMKARFTVIIITQHSLRNDAMDVKQLY